MRCAAPSDQCPSRRVGMPEQTMERLSLERIREFWTSQAVEHEQSPSASWSDHPVIELEIKEILKRIQNGDRVLDVGCANGFTTLSLASNKNVTVRGLDY